MKPFQITDPFPTVENLSYALRRMAVNFKSVAFGSENNDPAKNIQGFWASLVTPATAATNFTITHNLGYVPVGFHVVSKFSPCDVYNGSLAWTSTTITLQCTVASANIRLFIF